MNKEIIYVDGKVVVEDENGNKRITENSDKIKEILVQENVIETIEKRIKKLEKKISKTEYVKHDIPVAPFVAFILVFFSASMVALGIAFALLGKLLFGFNLVMSDIILGLMKEVFRNACIADSLILLPSLHVDWSSYIQHKNSKKERQGSISEYKYLKKQIGIEKEKLEGLRKQQTITSETQELKFEKVDDLERLKELRNKLSVYNSLGYNMDKYYRYYQAGRLEEKLSRQYDESSISEISKYFESEGPKLVKRKQKKGNIRL